MKSPSDFICISHCSVTVSPGRPSSTLRAPAYYGKQARPDSGSESTRDPAAPGGALRLRGPGRPPGGSGRRPDANRADSAANVRYDLVCQSASARADALANDGNALICPADDAAERAAEAISAVARPGRRGKDSRE